MSKEYVMFYRSGKGAWYKCLEQAIYINDVKGFEYVDNVDLEDVPIKKPPYVRGTPVLIKLEPYGDKGPSRWEGTFCLHKLQDISGVDTVDNSKRTRVGQGVPKTQPVTVPTDSDDEEEVWGDQGDIAMDASDYAAEDELYPR
jgi:hypothetical protein